MSQTFLNLKVVLINERITKSDSELVYIGSKREVDAVINLHGS